METESKNPQEMSIEDILQSIKNIIGNSDTKLHIENDINNNKISNRNTKSQHESDILELTEIVNEKKNSDNNKEDESDLISEESAKKIINTIQEFIEKISIQYKNENQNRSSAIEKFVIDIITPLLKEWLDMNLQNLVEKIIIKEIKKLIPNNKNSINY